MKDTFIHEDDMRFDEFIEETLKGLSERAEEHGICVECLSDRLIVEWCPGWHVRELRHRPFLAWSAMGWTLQKPMRTPKGKANLAGCTDRSRLRPWTASRCWPAPSGLFCQF